jgi:hypothetical protein
MYSSASAHVSAPSQYLRERLQSMGYALSNDDDSIAPRGSRGLHLSLVTRTFQTTVALWASTQSLWLVLQARSDPLCRRSGSLLARTRLGCLFPSMANKASRLLLVTPIMSTSCKHIDYCLEGGLQTVCHTIRSPLLGMRLYLVFLLVGEKGTAFQYAFSLGFCFISTPDNCCSQGVNFCPKYPSVSFEAITTLPQACFSWSRFCCSQIFTKSLFAHLKCGTSSVHVRSDKRPIE